MLLGALIKQAMRAQGPFAAEIGMRDPELATRLYAEAARIGLDRRGFVADTVSRFMSAEDSESWTTIVSAIQRSDDPGAAFLETVMRLRLSHTCAP
ncbi:MAG: hypothetical protein ACT4N8_10750 [Sphingosinicella sp.]|uniref:hypothetical protein n=1 Tax=Sphingosinicella sp. TaxID=1917971 RepID=UPI00403777C4